VSGLRQSFLDAMAEPLRATWAARADLDGALDRCLDEARQAWPRIPLPGESFAAHLAGRISELSEQEDGQVELAELRTSDLYLACACAAGDDAAIAAFDRTYFGEVDAAAALVRVGADVAADAKQTLRRLLFVSEGERRAALASFRGQADLRGWLRVAAVRELVRLSARGKRESQLDDDTLIDALSPALDPELGYIRELYRKETSAAFVAALRGLPSRERSLLRYQLVEGLTLEEIASLLGVSRATVIRRLADARRAVVERTRAELAERLGADAPEVESVIRLVRSRLDVSLETALMSDQPRKLR
jgi:RNA polymerase sigma-70 factor, ECF subfamily